MRHERCHNPGGFTILELAVVIAIIAVISVSALPAFDQVRASRQGAARGEVLSLLRSARTHATALGDPCGLWVDASSGLLQLVTVPPGGTTQALLDALGAPEPKINLGLVYPGAQIASVTLPDGGAGPGVIWFGNTGTPELRDADGAYAGPARVDAEIVVQGQTGIRVDRLTGQIR
ncbi:MAG: hypothetical protein Kow0022_18750 [Phycisphaerales bacterium]